MNKKTLPKMLSFGMFAPSLRKAWSKRGSGVECLKICKQCGKEFNNRGKLCQECFTGVKVNNKLTGIIIVIVMVMSILIINKLYRTNKIAFDRINIEFGHQAGDIYQLQSEVIEIYEHIEREGK